MSMTTVAYARRAYKSFSRSARHIYQLIASHQSLQTGWAYVGYACLADESSLTPRRVMQLVAWLEAQGALEVRRGHGRGHVNFYRVLREEDGLPVGEKVKSRGEKTVKFPTPPASEKVKWPTVPPPEKVKSDLPNSQPPLPKTCPKIVERKERRKRGAAGADFSLARRRRCRAGTPRHQPGGPAEIRPPLRGGGLAATPPGSGVSHAHTLLPPWPARRMATRTRPPPGQTCTGRLNPQTRQWEGRCR
jgi:hypothetical protein